MSELGPFYAGARAYVRADAAGAPPRIFGPKAATHPTVGRPCPACGVPFAPGDMTTLVPLGPGADPAARVRRAQRRPYNAVALECHAACVFGAEGDADA